MSFSCFSLGTGLRPICLVQLLFWPVKCTFNNALGYKFEEIVSIMPAEMVIWSVRINTSEKHAFWSYSKHKRVTDGRKDRRCPKQHIHIIRKLKHPPPHQKVNSSFENQFTVLVEHSSQTIIITQLISYRLVHIYSRQISWSTY
jgi:hypothetical protein